MKKIISTVVLIVLSVSLFGCGGKAPEKQKKADTAINVSVQKAERKTIENTVTYTGEIKASESTSVSAKVSGSAKVVYKEVGDYVNEGDVLLQIDDTDYRTQYNQALSVKNQAQAAYNGALAQYNSIINGSTKQTKLQLETALSAATIEYNNAKTNYENQKILYENGAVSKAVYDAAVTRFENAKLNLETAQSNYNLTVDVVLEESKANAQAAVNTAKAALDSATVAIEAAQNSLANTTLRAPISGYIATRNANKGQMVPAGVEVFSIKATQSLEAQINVTESIIPNVNIGAKAIINVKAANANGVEGSVTNVSPVKNAQTGLYSVYISIKDETGMVKDGMFADITLTLNDSVDALVIPSEAVLEDKEGTKYVYVANENTAKRADVVVGIINDDFTEIVSGITENDQVVVSGKDYLSETNNKIRIVK